MTARRLEAPRLLESSAARRIAAGVTGLGTVLEQAEAAYDLEVPTS